MRYTFSFIALAVLFLVKVATLPFLPSVGGKPSKKDRLNYLERASNYDGKQFFNPEDEAKGSPLVKTDEGDPNLMSLKPTSPEVALPQKIPSFIENPLPQEFSLTWFGHSTLLIQMHGMNILFDPLFTTRVSPVSWIGPKKFFEPSIGIEELPKIDILILTHDHYDHLDYKAIKKLAPKVDLFVIPLGVEAHLKKWKVDSKKIINMAWWEEIEVEGLTIVSTPARHFSGRWLTGRNITLWTGYVLKDEYRQIFHSGDSGEGEHFALIHERYGNMDLAIMENGQYNLRWPTIHSFPEQAARQAAVLGAKAVLPIHWGAVVLSTNGWDDSILRFKKAADELGLTTLTPYLCQTVDLSKPENYQEEWYK